MVDIHEHILPGLDDGSYTIEESLDMAELAVSQGIRHIVCSSHSNRFSYSLNDYRNAFKRLQLALDQYSIPAKIYTGQELLLNERGLRLLKKGDVLPLNNTKYLLCEFLFGEQPDRMLELIRQVHALGWIPVLAHPERYDSVIYDPNLCYDLKNEGCILQCNGASFTGFYGRTVKKTALYLLRSGIISVLATDAHDAIERTSETGFLTALEKEFRPQLIHLWTSENPSRILKGMPILQERISV